MSPLAHVTVLERAGHLSVAACGHLLAKLGARVIRVEGVDEAARVARAAAPEARLRVHAKERVSVTAQSADAIWSSLLPAADVVLLSPTAPGDADHASLSTLFTTRPQRLIVCALSLTGHGEPDLPPDMSDALLQALGGLMAVTGQPGGPPEFARVPIGQLSAAVVASTAVLAALAQRDASGAGRLIDLSLVEIMADQLRVHIGLVHTGQTRGFRIGCGHPLCSPWNAYRARDGWILICSSGDAHWRALLEVVGQPELKQDARYLSMKARRERVQEVDALIQRWVGERSVREAIAALNAIDVPVGPALRATEVPNDPMLRAAGTVADTANGNYDLTPWRFRTYAQTGATASHPETCPPSGHIKLPSSTGRGTAPDALPLAGMRVVEFTRYAAGPLAGFLLASLGAEVIKIEPPGGEECRQWSPRFGPASGYFLNYNAGKRCLAVDLRDAGERERVHALIASADVVLHNMRPGAMERLGFGAADLLSRHPGLVYGAVSGFGPDGPQLPALDTVIQAQLGLTRLIGDADAPSRVGYSIADQLAGHFLAAGLVTALIERARSGRGLCVEVAMTDAIAWLTHLAWADERAALPPTCRIEASDGWVVASAATDMLAGLPDPTSSTREALIATLAQHGIAAAPVLEIDEVLTHPSLIARASLYEVATPGGGKGPLFAAPLGMRVARPERLAALEEGLPSLPSPSAPLPQGEGSFAHPLGGQA